MDEMLAVMPGHPQPGPEVVAAMTAAASPDWHVRVQAARHLAAAAEQHEVAQVLLSLLLDADDTAVTDATCQVLLDRGDIHAVRRIAQAAAAADDEQLDHLYGTVRQDRQPASSARQFRSLCRDLGQDRGRSIREGARQLITWIDEPDTSG
jgi:hypothetical protein